MTTLPRIEVTLYFTIWVGGIICSVSNVYSASQRYYKFFFEEDMTKGWGWLSPYRDVADPEWREWIPLIQRLFPWLIVHFIGSEIARWNFSKTVEQLWSILVSLAFMNHLMGFFLMAVMSAYPLIIINACYKGGIRAAWVLTVTSIYGLNFIHFDEVPETAMFLWHVSMAWLQLRCISFCVDKTAAGSTNVKPIWELCSEMLSYCLFLPTLVLGPFISYAAFKERDPQLVSWASLSQRVTQLVFGILRYSFWAFFLNVSLHFLFYNALQLNTEILKTLDGWSMNGVAFCAGQFFCMKYIVTYGIAGTFAKADGRVAPAPPCCVARISLYSAMWRNFDKGFYNFLVRYVYGPLLSHGQGLIWRFACSAISFLFVGVWHGASPWTFVWAMFNFLGITIESIARVIIAHPKYQSLEKILSPNNVLRWRALAASPLFVTSAYANFYFFGGRDTAVILLSQIWTGSPLRLVCLLLFAYCCCQVANVIDSWERKRAAAGKKED